VGTAQFCTGFLVRPTGFIWAHFVHTRRLCTPKRMIISARSIPAAFRVGSRYGISSSARMAAAITPLLLPWASRQSCRRTKACASWRVKNFTKVDSTHQVVARRPSAACRSSLSTIWRGNVAIFRELEVIILLRISRRSASCTACRWSFIGVLDAFQVAGCA